MQYEKRILSSDTLKPDRLSYGNYKTLVDGNFKDPLKKLPLYNVELYKKTLANQETLVQRVIDARRQCETPDPIPEDLLNVIMLDMTKIYMVDTTMIHYCQDELIANQDLSLVNWKTHESLTKIYFTGFLVCGAMEGFSFIEGFSTVIEKIYKYPLYEGILKMNMKHADQATYYRLNFKIIFEPPLDLSDDEDSTVWDPVETEDLLSSPFEKYVGGFVTNHRQGFGTIFGGYDQDLGLLDTKIYSLEEISSEFYGILDATRKTFQGTFNSGLEEGPGTCFWWSFQRQPDGTRIYVDKKCGEGNYLDGERHGRCFKSWYQGSGG
jgi:hypothetical protein